MRCGKYTVRVNVGVYETLYLFFSTVKYTFMKSLIKFVNRVYIILFSFEI